MQLHENYTVVHSENYCHFSISVVFFAIILNNSIHKWRRRQESPIAAACERWKEFQNKRINKFDNNNIKKNHRSHHCHPMHQLKLCFCINEWMRLIYIIIIGNDGGINKKKKTRIWDHLKFIFVLNACHDNTFEYCWN